MANPFYVEPANPLQALLTGQKSYGETRDRRLQDELKALQSEAGRIAAGGDYKSAIGMLLGAGDWRGAGAASGLLTHEAEQAHRAATLAEQRAHHAAIENKPIQVGSPEHGHGLYFPPGRTPQGPAPGSGMFPDPPSPNATFPDPATRAAPGQTTPIGPGRVVQVTPPKEKPQKELSAKEQDIILKDENAIGGFESAINNIEAAKKINDKVFTGVFAETRGRIGTSGIPGSNIIADEDRAKATREWNQIMSLESIKNMSETLKGASTEGEMRKFLMIAADVTNPPDVRGKAMERFQDLAKRELGIRMLRMKQIRERSWVKPEGGQSGAKVATEQPAGGYSPRSGEGYAKSIEVLQKNRNNPKVMEFFDAKYGPGAAARELGME